LKGDALIQEEKSKEDLSLKEMYEPTVSVIVPVLNAEETIGDLLDSLMRVDYDKNKLEIILVDGGSTDRTREIIQSYPVRLIVEKRKGLNVARNTGIRSSKGEIVLFTDSDCVVSRGWIRQIVKNFRDKEVGCVGGSVFRYEENFLSRYADESIMPVLRRFRRRRVLRNVEPPMSYPAGCNMAFRRDVFKKVGEFDEEIHYGFDEDELVERACKAGYKMILDPEVVVKHRHRPDLKRLLRQTFSYGRGGGLIFKKRGFKDRLAKWNMIVLASFLTWLSVCLLLTFLSIFYNIAYVAILSLLTVFPLIILVIFYAWKVLKKNRVTVAIFYACLDLLRLFAYCSGEIIGLF